MDLPLRYLPLIVDETECSLHSVEAVIHLSSQGSTIPFIARYRKEATGNLNEVQIQKILEQATYYQELDERKIAVLKSIESQNKLTDELRKQIEECTQKTVLEDLYLPYKQRRKTRADTAKEQGLEPLADAFVTSPDQSSPRELAASFVNETLGVKTIEDALKGARDIWAQRISEHVEIRTWLRDFMRDQGVVVCAVRKDWKEKPSKYEQYYDYRHKAKEITSHAFLAIQRGAKEEVLSYSIDIDAESLQQPTFKKMFSIFSKGCVRELEKSVEDALKRLLLPSIETQICIEIKERSDLTAVEVFSENITHLLLAAPFGQKTVLGIDPGWRTGCKCSLVSELGQFIAYWTIFPFDKEQEAVKQLLQICQRYEPKAIAIGNGTAGRETLQFVQKTIKTLESPPIALMINESGASIYSASDIAREEFPDLDLTLRGAISIARRLQDPLAELVKVDPQSIGVGQYQHDVSQQLLHDRLNSCVEFCVNKVGVELNSSSETLLSYVSGIGRSLAKKIVNYKKQNGKFTTRSDLLKVPGLGPLAFQQSAGFLRISDGRHPLDASAVHPESYPIVEDIVAKMGVSLENIIGNQSLVTAYLSREKNLSWTVKDILNELVKPGRDPRSDFTIPNYRDDVMEIKDLKVNMQLEGVVTNVTAFGAFVDVGVHQDGLVHLSQLADHYVAHPKDVVKPGQKVKVTVVEVDVERKRISLSMKKNPTVGASVPKNPSSSSKKMEPQKEKHSKKSSSPFAHL